jgi:predicted Zn-dependent peptidase
MFAEYAWFERYVENLETVTPQDVQRVAQEYLHPAHRVVGIYRPSGEALEESDAEEQA